MSTSKKEQSTPLTIWREDELTGALRKGGKAVLERLKETGIDPDQHTFEKAVRLIAETRYTLMLFVLQVGNKNKHEADLSAYNDGVEKILKKLARMRLMVELMDQLAVTPRTILDQQKVSSALETILLNVTFGNHGKRFDMLLRYYADPESIPECTPSIASCMLADLVGRIRDILSPVTETTPAASLLEHEA
jgi:hypothetical protein